MHIYYTYLVRLLHSNYCTCTALLIDLFMINAITVTTNQLPAAQGPRLWIMVWNAIMHASPQNNSD